MIFVRDSNERELIPKPKPSNTSNFLGANLDNKMYCSWAVQLSVDHQNDSYQTLQRLGLKARRSVVPYWWSYDEYLLSP